jgi:hypothetical protein
MVLTCHDRSPLSSPALLRSTWIFMARWFFDQGFVWALNAGRRSGSAGTATADSATAPQPAGLRPGAFIAPA